MPRSRRKAAASRAQTKGITKDFVKKKERLGRKIRPANSTDTSVRARQIYIPDAPCDDQPPDASAKRGLSLPQLIVRATHYSANTRQSALNGLARALTVDDAAASSDVRSDIARVLRIALAALQDDAPAVRVAANSVLAAALKHSPAVRPFATLLSARIVACLSHIRAEVQLSGAQAVHAIFSGTEVEPAEVFEDRLPVLVAALSDLLSSVKSMKSRTVVLHALCAILKPRLESKSKRLGDGHGSVKGSVSPYGVRCDSFYYHKLSSDSWSENSVLHGNDLQKTSEISADMEVALDKLCKHVVNVVTESLPVHDAKKDKVATTMLLAAVRTLYFLTSLHHLSEMSIKLVCRVLETWSKERNRHHDGGDALTIHNFLAGCAVCVERWKLAGVYIEPSLSSEVARSGQSKTDSEEGFLSVEDLTLNLLRSCSDVSTRTKILNAWMQRWIVAIAKDKVAVALSSSSILSCVIDDFLRGLKEEQWAIPEVESSGWKVLTSLPKLILHVSQVVRSQCSPSTQLSQNESSTQLHSIREFIRIALGLLVRASRICCRVQSDQSSNFKKNVSEYLLQYVILHGLHIDALEDLVSVFYYTKVFASTQGVRIIVQSLHIGSRVSLDFCIRLLVLFEAHLIQFEENGHENILLDLFAVVSYILSTKKPVTYLQPTHKHQWDDFISIAQRLSERIGLVEG